MNHPIISSANGKIRYSEMVQTADNYRRLKQLQQDKQPRPSYLTRFSNFLARIVGQAESDETTTPVARAS